jgi:hypothetical protein
MRRALQPHRRTDCYRVQSAQSRTCRQCVTTTTLFDVLLYQFDQDTSLTSSCSSQTSGHAGSASCESPDSSSQHVVDGNLSWSTCGVYEVGLHTISHLIYTLGQKLCILQIRS